MMPVKNFMLVVTKIFLNRHKTVLNIFVGKFEDCTQPIVILIIIRQSITLKINCLMTKTS